MGDKIADGRATHAGEPKQSKAGHPPLRPKDAATLVIVDWSKPDPAILMGRRHMDQVFLPGHYVFPGGRVEAADRTTPLASELSPVQVESLMLEMRGRPSRARATALAVAAVRETYEETGFLIAGAFEGGQRLSIGTSEAWVPALSNGVAPALRELVYFARAITPPGRPRRYDTRFFAISRSAVTSEGSMGGDGELEDLAFRTLAEARGLKLPSITRLVLEDINRLADAGFTRPDGPPPVPETYEIPFYFQSNGSFQRALLSRTESIP